METIQNPDYLLTATKSNAKRRDAAHAVARAAFESHGLGEHYEFDNLYLTRSGTVPKNPTGVRHLGVKAARLHANPRHVPEAYTLCKRRVPDVLAVVLTPAQVDQTNPCPACEMNRRGFKERFAFTLWRAAEIRYDAELSVADNALGADTVADWVKKQVGDGLLLNFGARPATYGTARPNVAYAHWLSDQQISLMHDLILASDPAADVSVNRYGLADLFGDMRRGLVGVACDMDWVPYLACFGVEEE